MYVFYDSTGRFVNCAVAPAPVEGFTAPTGQTALFLDDTQYAYVAADWTNYSYINAQVTHTPVVPTLAEAQAAQIASIRAGYNATIEGGFDATIGTTQYTFGWSTDDKANLDAVQSSVDKGFLTFPLQYADIHGSPVTLNSQADLDTIESTATKFFNAQHQQVLSLVGQVQSATDVTTVQGVTWTEASY